MYTFCYKFSVHGGKYRTDFRYFRYLIVDIWYFSVLWIPTSVSVSVFQNIGYRFGISVYRPKTSVNFCHMTLLAPCCMSPHKTCIRYSFIGLYQLRLIFLSPTLFVNESALNTDAGKNCIFHRNRRKSLVRVTVYIQITNNPCHIRWTWVTLKGWTRWAQFSGGSRSCMLVASNCMT